MPDKKESAVSAGRYCLTEIHHLYTRVAKPRGIGQT